MLTKARHTLNAAGLVAVIALATMVSLTSGAGAAGLPPFASGSLIAPLPGSQGVVSPSLLTRNGEGSFGSFSGESPQSLTVDQATGDIYAIEPSAGKLWRFAPNGTAKNFTAGPDAGTNSITGLSFQGFPGLDQVAVDSSPGPAKGDIYVTESGVHRVKVFASTGEPLATLTGTANGGLGEDCGIAVDQSNGDVYIANRGFSIWRYTPTSNPVSEADYSGGIEVGIEPCQLAVAGSSLYAKQWQEFPILSAGPLDKYSTSAFAPEEFGFGSGPVIAQNVTAVATDPSTGDVYADIGNKITVFDSAGASLYSFGSSSDFGSESVGVAVDSSSGTVYVADPLNHRVDVYGPAVVAPPIATTGEANEIRHVKTTLHGHLDPNEGPEITDCHFDWGATTTYGHTAPCDQGNAYASPSDVSATITGLEPGATYHYRLDISTGTNTVTGTDQTVEAAPLKGRRDLLGVIGPDGTSASSFSELKALAFRPSTSTLYAAGVHGLYGFDASAPPAYTPIAGFSPLATAEDAFTAGLALDTTGLSSAGNLYLADQQQRQIYGLDSTGTALGGAFPINPATNPGPPTLSFGEPCGAAVDSTGQLWVNNPVTRQILRYSSNGVFQGSLDASAQGSPTCGLAFDSNNDLYVDFEGQSTWRYTAASGYTEATQIPTTENYSLSVDQTNHHLVVSGLTSVREFDSSGHLLAIFADNVPGASYRSVAIDPIRDHVFLADVGNGNIRVYGPAIVPPEVIVAQASTITNTTSTIRGTVDAQGFALTDCHFEYATETQFQANGFTGAASAPCAPRAGAIPADLEDHTVSADITGLERNTTYHYRLVATNTQGTSESSDTTLTTTGPPSVETVGSPVRTATTAQFEGRVDPHGVPATYHFEYGDQGPCASNPCTSTPQQSAGAGDLIEFVSQAVAGLKADTIYHYRLVADNGNVDGPDIGDDFTVTTRTSDAPLTHGHFPGPPGSDRAWEQVNTPDTDGNPVDGARAVSDSGERVVYNVDGATPGSAYGGGVNGENNQYAERTPSGWRTKSLYPTRAQSPGNYWEQMSGRSDLSELYDTKGDTTGSEPVEIWRMRPGTPAQLVLSVPVAQYTSGTPFTITSADGSRVIAALRGDLDPEHPVGPGVEDLYDVTTGTPHMVGLLPDGSTPPCGIGSEYQVKNRLPPYEQKWLTADGSHLFFRGYPGTECGGKLALYVHDLVNSTTVQIAPEAKFIRSAGGAAFFMTEASLVPGDHGGNDLYRYTIDDGSIDCLTCSTAAAGLVSSAGTEAENNAYDSVAVSNDGSRLYFLSEYRLVPGAANKGIYRLDASSRSLAYVAPAEGVVKVGNYLNSGNAMSPDGSVFVFVSNGAGVNAVNGQQNDGTLQYYLYDDNDRSLVCVSCAPSGSSPRGEVPFFLDSATEEGLNGSPVTSKGDFIFITPTPLVRADQNTAPPGQSPEVGDDVYEWREGRPLLISDGQTFNKKAPGFAGVSPSGRDVFFTQAAQLTPDAIDPQKRLYDARIGGGFSFPSPLPPCSLEACQGIPMPPPSDATPSSLTFSGPGNRVNSSASSKLCGSGGCAKAHPRKRCVKGKILKRGKCVKKRRRKRARRANHNHGGAK